jgi:hypothetical protein
MTLQASAPTLQDLKNLVSDIQAYIAKNHATTDVPVELTQQGAGENLGYTLVIGKTRLVAKHLHTVEEDGEPRITPQLHSSHGQDYGVENKGVFFSHADNPEAWGLGRNQKDPVVRYIMALSIEKAVAGEGFPGLLVHKGDRLRDIRVSGQVDSDYTPTPLFVTGKKPFAEVIDKIVEIYLGRPHARRHEHAEAQRLHA